MLKKIPLKRLLIYLVILGFLPIALTVLHISKKNREWEAISQSLFNLQKTVANSKRKQALNFAVRTIYSNSEPLYIENHLDSLSFLKREKEALERLLNSPTFTGNEAAEKRYAFVASKANHFEWTQANLQALQGVQQTELFLSHPLEIDAQDLKEILTRIEGPRKGKPQLLIKEFKLNKKELPNKNEVFELTMKLLKREFTS